MDVEGGSGEGDAVAAPEQSPGAAAGGRRRRLGVLAAILMAVVVAVGLVVASGIGPWGGAEEVVRGCEGDDHRGAADPDGRYSFGSLEDWERHADVVARVEVVGEERGRDAADDPGAEAPRYLRLAVQRSYAGDVEPGDVLGITSNEPYLRNTEGEVVVAAGTDCFGLVVGDEAVVALLGDGTDASESALLTHDSVFLVDGADIARTRRSSAAIDAYEGEPLADLERDLVEVLG